MNTRVTKSTERWQKNSTTKKNEKVLGSNQKSNQNAKNLQCRSDFKAKPGGELIEVTAIKTDWKRRMSPRHDSGASQAYQHKMPSYLKFVNSPLNKAQKLNEYQSKPSRASKNLKAGELETPSDLSIKNDSKMNDYQLVSEALNS